MRFKKTTFAQTRLTGEFWESVAIMHKTYGQHLYYAHTHVHIDVNTLQREQDYYQQTSPCVFFLCAPLLRLFPPDSS